MRGLIHGTMHLSIGQASAVSTTMDLRKTDYITSTIAATATASARGPIRS
jgi:TPP-dependent pyruvate/acetoin dehydrogenase alpha subunit